MIILFIIIILILLFIYSKSLYYNDLNFTVHSKVLNQEQFSNNNINCCHVQKIYSEDSNNINGGNFKYIYNKLENDQCNKNEYPNNFISSELLIDGENNWDNKYCNNDSKYLGSCRFANKECIDFVSKDFCDNYKLTWSELTCNNPIPGKCYNVNPKTVDINPDTQNKLF
jgi:hypothetical protein